MGWKDTIQEKKSSWRDTIKEPDVPPRSFSDVSVEGTGRALTSALPIIGGAVGGMLGAAGGPVGAVAGSGAGYALGHGAQNMIEQYLYEDPKEAKGIPGKILETAGDIGRGATLELGGQALNAAYPVVKPVLTKAAELIPGVSTAKTIVNAVRPKEPASIPVAPRAPEVDLAPTMPVEAPPPVKSWDFPVRKVHTPSDKKTSENTTRSSDWLTATVNKSPEKLGEFGPVLSQAVQRGSDSLAASHYILESTNPKYREYLKQIKVDADSTEDGYV